MEGIKGKKPEALEPTLELNIQVPHIQGVVLNELPSRLDFIAHQFGEHLLGFNRIGNINPKKFSVTGIHGGAKQLLRVHFA